jgi:hypothetical protein
MFQREQVFTITDVANYTTQAAEKMFEFENKTFFWTKHQKALIDSSPRRVIFTSEFGTGKTTLLKAKAKQLGRETHLQKLKKLDPANGKVYFVVFIGRDALLTQSLKSEMKDLVGHVEIISLSSELN